MLGRNEMHGTKISKDRDQGDTRGDDVVCVDVFVTMFLPPSLSPLPILSTTVLNYTVRQRRQGKLLPLHKKKR